MTRPELEQALKSLGERRIHLRAQEAQIMVETRLLVNEARQSNVPMTEVSRLLGLDRTYLYRAFVPRSAA